MDSKDATLFGQSIRALEPVYELPSPGGGGGESELDGEETGRTRHGRAGTGSSPLNPSPLRQEELISRDGIPESDAGEDFSGRFGGHN